MRHSFVLHLALGLLSWSSQLAGAHRTPHQQPGGQMPRTELRRDPLVPASAHAKASHPGLDR